MQAFVLWIINYLPTSTVQTSVSGLRGDVDFYLMDSLSLEREKTLDSPVDAGKRRVSPRRCTGYTLHTHHFHGPISQALIPFSWPVPQPGRGTTSTQAWREMLASHERIAAVADKRGLWLQLLQGESHSHKCGAVR
ncbi:hypothetical protein B0T19DRAFT_417302 [Cercophora scortea]|uniref:Uncharacterized protein n=1 Tax=Cercophora scortea TaxID=314031 RepID=A0AAE0MI74_9PEZI|nr:hypothetical protein B0T19DRAFT_417302 [Cercophora scortea]